MSNKNDTVTEAIVRELGLYLKTNVAGILKVYDDWPSSNQKLDMPCISIMTGSPNFTPMMPYIVKKGAIDGDHKSGITQVFGQYEFKLQCDVWCSTKLQRHEMHEKFILAFHNAYNVAGLSRQLMDYYEQWARFEITGVDFVDSEQASQRGEWRSRISVTANVKACRKSLEHLMETIENTVETSSSETLEDEEESENESII